MQPSLDLDKENKEKSSVSLYLHQISDRNVCFHFILFIFFFQIWTQEVQSFWHYVLIPFLKEFYS